MAVHRNPMGSQFPWPAQVMRDSTYLMTAVSRISSDQHSSPEEMSRRLRSLQDEGCRPIDGELVAGMDVSIVSGMVTPAGDVMVRFWSPRAGIYEVDRFPLNCLGPRRRTGSRTQPAPWMEAPWETPEAKPMKSARSA
jgi:hypothetical protein